MHQHKCSVHKISEDGYQFTVVPVLEIFPGKIIVFCFRCIGTKYIAQVHLHSRENLLHIHLPIPPSCGWWKLYHLQYLKIHWQEHYPAIQNPMCFQHRRKNDAMKNNIVFADKMNQFGIFFSTSNLPIDRLILLWR